MKIAVWHNLPFGGAKRALFEMVRGLRGRGHVIESWSPPVADDSALFSMAELAREHVVPLGPQEVPNRLGWLYNRARAQTYLLKKMRSLEDHNRDVSAQINNGGFDVVLATTCQWLSVPGLAPLLNLPSVVFLHEPYRFLHEAAPVQPWLEEEFEAKGLLPELRYFAGSSLRAHPYRLIARRQLKEVQAFDMVLANSLFSRESILRAYGVDARVSYLGIDDKKFSYSSGARDAAVLSVGQFHALKNPEFLVRAIALTRTRPTLRWVCNVVHQQEYLDSIIALARRLAVTIEMHVAIGDDELVHHYQKASALLYAPRLEPFGYAPLEANACGTPVIAVAEGGVRETVHHGVNGMVASDVASMATAIDELMSNQGEARRLGEGGSSFVRSRWTLQVAAEQLESHLLDAIALRRQRTDGEQ